MLQTITLKLRLYPTSDQRKSLKDTINQTHRYEMVSWSFYQLEQFVAYKAQRIGSTLIKVDAHYTSQRDPKTGEINAQFRNHGRHEFYNAKSGTRSNDDRIGAMNIYELGKRYLTNQTISFVQ